MNTLLHNYCFPSYVLSIHGVTQKWTGGGKNKTVVKIFKYPVPNEALCRLCERSGSVARREGKGSWRMGELAAEGWALKYLCGEHAVKALTGFPAMLVISRHPQFEEKKGKKSAM